MTLRIKRSRHNKRSQSSRESKLRVVTPTDDLSLGHRLETKVNDTVNKTSSKAEANVHMVLQRLRDLARAALQKEDKTPQERNQVNNAYLLLLDEIKILGGLGEEPDTKASLTTLRVQRHLQTVDRCLTLTFPNSEASRPALSQAARMRALASVNQLRVHLQNVSSASSVPRDCDFALEAAKLTSWYLSPTGGKALQPSQELKDCVALSLLR